MRIAYDLQACQTDSRARGIGRYASNLVAAMVALSAQRGGQESIVCLDGTNAERLRDVRGLLRSRQIHAPTAVYQYPSASITDLSALHVEASNRLRARFYEALAPDWLLQLSHFEWGTQYSTGFHWSGVPPVASAVIAYDLIPLIYPLRYLPEWSPISEWYKKKCDSFRRFDMFLAISEATRHDLITYLDIPPERIVVIGAGLDTSLLAAASPDDQDAERLVRLGITEPFVFLVSNGDWRKNTLGAVQAFTALPRALRNSHLLVLTQVGEDVIAALQGEMRHVADRVRVLGKIDDATLGSLYRSCRVFFFPSLYEGFGLPLLEAMAFGAPVLSSKLGGLSEVVHDPRCLFDPNDHAAAAELLSKALKDQAFREDLRRGAAEFARTFTWERCAQKALDALGGSSPAASHIDRLPRGMLRVRDDDVEIWTELLCAGNNADDGALQLGLRSAAARGRRRILVDVSEVAKMDARSGIQRVVRNFCSGLAAISAQGGFDLQPVRWTEGGMLYANAYSQSSLGLPLMGHDEVVEVLPNDVLFMLDSSWIAPERFDQFYTEVWRAGGDVIWMVYDLIPLLYPQTCDPGMPPAFERWLSHAVVMADGFICISEATRNDLEQYIDRHNGFRRRPWTRSVWLGSDLDPGRACQPTDSIKALKARFDGAHYFMAVGTLEPRKDHATILAAFEQLWSSGHDCVLVIIGKQGWRVDLLAERLRRHPQAGGKLFWLEHVADADLAHLLRGATALVQASLAEGFGLPLIEAAALGVPLLLSDIPVFREIAGDEALYFEATNSPHLAAIIRQGLEQGFKQPRPGKIKTQTWREVSVDLSKRLLNLTA